MATKESFIDRMINLPVSDRTEGFIIGGAMLALGYLLAWLATSAFIRTMRYRLTAHQLLVWRRAIFYFLFLIFAISGLHEAGFKLSVLLGAAGVLTVAIGFASQTSASNLISGLFLIGEGSFAVGDTIQVGNTQGDVLSIDLLSIKLRTSDNVFVRIPNEQLIKSEVRNLTRFPIRRIAIPLGIAYDEDIGRVRRVLLDLADRHPLVLDEPPPQVTVQGFGPSAIDVQFTVWTCRETHAQVKDELQESLKRTFDEHGIAIPFPQVSISTGRIDPLSVVLRREDNGNHT